MKRPTGQEAVTNPSVNEQLLTVREVAVQCRVGIRTVWTWIALGRLRAVRLSKRCTRIRESDLRLFLEAAPTNT